MSTTMPDTRPAARPTVYYDGACPLCRREIALYRRGAGGEAVAWEDVSKARGEVEPGFTADQAMARFHMRKADGTRVSGAEAFVSLWETLPGWRRLAFVRRLPGAMRLLEAGYRGFLKVRPGISSLMRRLEGGR